MKEIFLILFLAISLNSFSQAPKHWFYEDLSFELLGRESHLIGEGRAAETDIFKVHQIAEIEGDKKEVKVRTFLLHPEIKNKTKDIQSGFCIASRIEIGCPYLGKYESFVLVDGIVRYLIEVEVVRGDSKIRLTGFYD